MGLEEIFKELGAEIPFDETGDLTSEGADAFDKLLRIVDGLDYIGALDKKGDELETYLDEIVRLVFWTKGIQGGKRNERKRFNK